MIDWSRAPAATRVWGRARPGVGKTTRRTGRGRESFPPPASASQTSAHDGSRQWGSGFHIGIRRFTRALMMHPSRRALPCKTHSHSLVTKATGRARSSPCRPPHAYTNRKTHPPSPSRQYTPHRSRVTITNIGTTLEQYSPSLACLLPVHCVQQGTEEHSAIFLFTSSGVARVFAHALGWSSPPTQAQIESRSEIISPGFVKVETAKRPLGSLVSLSWGK